VTPPAVSQRHRRRRRLAGFEQPPGPPAWSPPPWCEPPTGVPPASDSRVRSGRWAWSARRTGNSSATI